MVPKSKGQQYLDFAGDMHRLLSEAPVKDHAVTGKGYRAEDWYHHLGGMMIVACMSSLEETLGRTAWKTHNFRVDEFEVVRCLRNAYVHTGSDVSGVDDATCLTRVQQFLKDLKAAKVLGQNGKTPIEPYFELSGSTIKLNERAIRRMQALYIGLLGSAGEIA